ncbi:MAG: DNA topoisomerase VI subunit B [Verrucomicrobia bacterium]|nr:DNA topoisomerase VI subunit B [Verrucomicrobiota bacterium]MDA1085608.1 DNA topoisomerase VI subunit B [Verrucomicrobiota bacterium]
MAKRKAPPKKKQSAPAKTKRATPARKKATRSTERGPRQAPATAESMALRQRDISVSEFFLKNRHLLGFDSPRRALVTCVKEAVDNSLDACEEAHLLPEISVDMQQTGENRFRIEITDNGPGIVKAQVPQIFAKLLYGSKFHRLRMSRGQQGIGISAAGMYGQLTTGSSTTITSRHGSKAHKIAVQIDARRNKPTILSDEEIDWKPTFFPTLENGKPGKPVAYRRGTSVSIEMEAAYVRGKLSVDEYLAQCAIVNPHLQLYYRVRLLKKGEDETETSRKSARSAKGRSAPKKEAPPEADIPWVTFFRVSKRIPKPPDEIKPHPHGVELGNLMQMLKDTTARTIRAALNQDFSRVSSKAALQICQTAKLNPKANPARIAHRESEALYKAIAETKLMRPPTDCLSPIGEDQILMGLKKEIDADFYTAITRPPTVYRGNPFQIEIGIAYAKPGENENLPADDAARVLRFANRVPLLYMAGGCALTRAVSDVNWKNYGLPQPRRGLPIGPMVVTVHMCSVWVPFTSESKDAVAHYSEIMKEAASALQEGGRRLSVYLNKRNRLAEAERKKNYMQLYVPHLALGLKEILQLGDRQESAIVKNLNQMLERSHLET